MTPPTPPRTPERPVRFNAKAFLLTWARADWDNNELLDWLKGKHELTEATVCKEPHEDGGFHHHAFFVCKDRLDIRRADFWDYRGVHPNIQVARNRRACRDYCKKDGSYIVYGSQLSWADILETTKTKDQFLQAVRETFPRNYVLDFDRLVYFAETHFSTKTSCYTTTYDGFDVPEELANYRLYNLTGPLYPERPKALVLWGPSRLGKTCWARSLGTHIYWNNLIDMSLWDPHAQYIVLDDIDWDFLPCKKPLLGCQQEFTITDKYRKKRSVVWGKPCIYLCNDIVWYCKATIAWKQWLDANVVFFNIEKRLY